MSAGSARRTVLPWRGRSTTGGRGDAGTRIIMDRNVGSIGGIGLVRLGKCRAGAQCRSPGTVVWCHLDLLEDALVEECTFIVHLLLGNVDWVGKVFAFNYNFQ